MAIKTISQFPSGTPTNDDYILFEQNGEGKSTTIGDAVNTCALSYEEIMATNPEPDLTGKVASAKSVLDIGGRILTGIGQFPSTSGTGPQTIFVSYGKILPNSPKAVFLTWAENDAIFGFCQGLSVQGVENRITEGFHAITNRLNGEYNWNFNWLVVY